MGITSKRLGALLWIAILLPSAAVAWRYRDMPHLGLLSDDGLYWVSAKSLAETSSYRILSFPGAPYQTKYPPLYPLLLSAIWRLDPHCPENLKWATALCWLFLPACLYLARKWYRKQGMGSLEAWALCGGLALDWYCILYSCSMMSELPFLCLLLGCLLAVESGRGFRSGLLAGAAFLVRSAGGVLLIAAPLYFVMKKRYRSAAAFMAAMAPFLAGWALWTRARAPAAKDAASLYYTSYRGFEPPLAAFGFLKKLGAIASGAGNLLIFNAEGSVGRGVVLGVVGAAMIFGAVLLIRRSGVTAYHVFAAVYMLLLLGWPLVPGDHWARLMLPLLPLFLAGIGALASWLFRFDPHIGPVGAMIFAAVSSLSLPACLSDTRLGLNGNLPAYRWIAGNTAPSTRFLASQDTVLYLYTGRQACRILSPPETEDVSAGRSRDYVLGYTHELRLTYLLDSPSVDLAAMLDPEGRMPRIPLSPQATLVALPK